MYNRDTVSCYNCGHDAEFHDVDFARYDTSYGEETVYLYLCSKCGETTTIRPRIEEEIRKREWGLDDDLS